jgi:DNA-binding NtrC family response regulator
MIPLGAGPGLHILVVEDDAEHAARMRLALTAMEPGVRVTIVARLRAALDAVRDPAVVCVVTDLSLPDAADASVVRALRAVRHEVPVIVVTACGSEELAVAAMKLGAADYLRKQPRYVERLPTLVREALGRSVLAGVPSAGDGHVGGDRKRDDPLLTSAGGMRAVLGQAERAAESAVPVLIQGETGTGKELVARAIHQRGPRRKEPFLVQNCAAISESLLESELFGHVRGAFTGAERTRRGLFEEAGDGTVFLDEIGEAPPAVQAKLLRVIQHEEVKAVGADAVRRVRARIVAATNRSLEAESGAGRFRPDLYYRLAVFPIYVPPLRHRAADIPGLVAHFLRHAELREGRETGGIDADALRALQSYLWPGNVRELENEIHRLVLCTPPGQRIRRHHLSRRIHESAPGGRDEPLERVLARVQIAIIRQRLQEKATKSAAARSLGITREALYAKMRRLGMATRES